MTVTTKPWESPLDAHFERLLALPFDHLLDNLYTESEPTMTAPSFSLPFTVTDADGDALTISASPELGIARGVEGALIREKSVGSGSIGTFVSKEEAPRVALAVLMAAGINPDSHGSAVESAAATLASIQARQERAAKLEADALELLNAANAALGFDTHESLDAVRGEVREAWIQVAKTSRKLAATA